MRLRTDRIGRRGAILAVLAVLNLAYGSAIVYARSHIPDPRVSSVGWWPASQDHLLLIPTQVWGWIWIVAGVGLASGICRRNDRWHFTVATVLKVCWACAATFNFLNGRSPGLWGISAFYIGLATLVFIITGWPEPTPPLPPPPLHDDDEEPA